MTDQHPITPPPELRRQWLDNDDFPFVAGTNNLLSITKDRLNSVMDQAARWGADQELEACCEWLECNYNYPQVNHPLRAARRPRSPSLKEQALAVIENSAICDHLSPRDSATIRRALEALDD